MKRPFAGAGQAERFGGQGCAHSQAGDVTNDSAINPNMRLSMLSFSMPHSFCCALSQITASRSPGRTTIAGALSDFVRRNTGSPSRMNSW